MQSLWLRGLAGDRVRADWVRLELVLSAPHLYSGVAYLAAAQGTAATRGVSEDLDHSGIVWNCWTGALAHLGIARANALEAHRLQGTDADIARRRSLAAYRDFLTLWKDAEPDVPLLKEAKAEYEKLQ